MHDKVIIRICTDAEKQKLLNDYQNIKNGRRTAIL